MFRTYATPDETVAVVVDAVRERYEEQKVETLGAQF